MNNYEIKTDCDFSFPDETAPMHIKYFYGQMEIGQTIKINCYSDSLVRVRANVIAHANHYDKKFKTKKISNHELLVKRIK